MSNWITVRPTRNVRQTWPVWSDSTLADPFLNDAINLVFGTPTRNRPAQAGFNFQLNVAQDETNYYVYALLPGVSPEKLEISTVENRLTIAGEIEPTSFGPQLPATNGEEGEQPARNLKWLHRELPATALKFHRELELPTNINADAVEAVYDNGVLRLTVPQAPELRPRRISVATVNPQQ